MKLYFIDVILPIPLEKRFTYTITQAESEFLKVGMRVSIPFGKTKIYTGIVANIHQTAPLVYEAKDIHQILDYTPIVTQQQLKFWQWIANYYMCTEGEVMRAALPNAFLLESETIVSTNTSLTINDKDLKDDEFLIYEALQHQSSLKIQDISNILNKKNVLPVVKRLVEKEVVILNEDIYEKYKPKYVRYVQLAQQYTSEAALNKLLDDLNKNATKQREVILNLFSISAKTKKPVKVSELLESSNTSASTIKALVDKNILQEYHIQTDRILYDVEDHAKTKQLNQYQTKALQQIKTKFEDQNVVLLHGVTSSGKTEVYVKLIETTILEGKQVLYLLPEIALTTQLVTRLQDYFGEQVAVFHSKYSTHERVEVYNHVFQNSAKAKIILGARSSIFLPFHNLGLIIVDEEHEQSFKQFDPAPRYHARDAAVVLASFFNAKILLGSATPSIESYHNAQENKYGLVEINRRYNNVQMPVIELVDLKDKHKKKRMKGHFSDRLIEEMTETLKEGYQVILFQNRRGYSPIVECTACGHSPQCPNCDVSLTYHQYRKQLRCHYCGYGIAMQQKCMACGTPDLDTLGFGTEQIEAEVKTLFPDFKVARMDLDTTRGKFGYEKIITAIEQQEIDVLVGTQMLTKGLDFRHVKLVGLLNADNMLNYPDFRAHERSFQLMLQVSGRAGRTEKRGKVLIQTYNPYHKILQQVSTNDFLGMFREQLQERYSYKYPPYFRLIKITLKHRDYNKVNLAADWLAKALVQLFKNKVLGPEFPPISRIRNQYHKNILIKIPQGQHLGQTKEAIKRIETTFSVIAEFKAVRLIINVDNY